MKNVFVIAELKGHSTRYLTENPHGICERGPFVGTLYSLHYEVLAAKQFDNVLRAMEFLNEFVTPFLPQDEIELFFFEIKQVWIHDAKVTGVKQTTEGINKIRKAKGRGLI